MTLFSRSVENDIASYLFYDLSPHLTSLFKIGITRNPKKKKKLQVYLIKNANKTELPGAAVHVIDGGAILHLVKWRSQFRPLKTLIFKN